MKFENHLVRPLRRMAAMTPAGQIGSVFRYGTEADPGAARLVGDWLTGRGPSQRIMPSGSQFSREFASAPGVVGHVQKALDLWRTRDGGVIRDGGKGYTSYKGVFGIPEFLMDGVAGNAASHTIGSFGLDGVRRGDKIIWTAKSDMGLHSASGGRLKDKFPDKIPWKPLPNVPRPLPTGTVSSTILFETDLNGRLLR